MGNLLILLLRSLLDRYNQGESLQVGERQSPIAASQPVYRRDGGYVREERIYAAEVVAGYGHLRLRLYVRRRRDLCTWSGSSGRSCDPSPSSGDWMTYEIFGGPDQMPQVCPSCTSSTTHQRGA